MFARKNNKFKLVLAAGAVALAISPFHAFAESNAASVSDLQEVLQLLQTKHISGTAKEELEKNAINGMIHSLKDPYTSYYSKDELASFTSSLENEFVGIGVRMRLVEEGMYLSEVMPDTPASKAGLQKGDLVTALNGASLQGKNAGELARSIQGKEGESVKLTVKRGAAVLDFNVTRAKFQVPAVTSKYFKESGVGYLQLTDFSSASGDQFANLLQALKAQGMKSLIIDLRDNPGGYVTTAEQIGKLFIKEGAFIHTKDRDNVDHPDIIEGGATQSFPVAVLVNENSASASEALTGALQDYNAAKVIGTRTFGKGVMQSIIPLSSGGALRVTTDEYLTPKLRKVDKLGIQPDLEVQGDLPQWLAAFHTLGAPDPEVKLGAYSAQINGVDIDVPGSVLRSEGKVYVPTRILVSVLGGTVVWNGVDQSLQVAVDGLTNQFKLSNGDFVMNNGTTYINPAVFAKLYPRLYWKDSADGVVLTTRKGK